MKSSIKEANSADQKITFMLLMVRPFLFETEPDCDSAVLYDATESYSFYL